MRRFRTLTGRLAHDPRSHLRARLAGGPTHWAQHLGWGPDQELAASVIDAVNLNTYVTAKVAGSKRMKTFPPHTRPHRRGEALADFSAPTIASFNVAALAAQTVA